MPSRADLYQIVVGNGGRLIEEYSEFLICFEFEPGTGFDISVLLGREEEEISVCIIETQR